MLGDLPDRADPTDVNRMRLERMFAQIDKPMRLPEPSKERPPPAPRENRSMMGRLARTRSTPKPGRG